VGSGGGGVKVLGHSCKGSQKTQLDDRCICCMKADAGRKPEAVGGECCAARRMQ
jgi:hypothetical protein